MTTTDPRDLADADPFVVAKRADETDGEFVRFEITVLPASGGPGAAAIPSYRRWLVGNPDEHLHFRQAERVEVRAGEYRVVVDGTEHALTDGDEITIRRNTPHRHWNPTDRPVRVVHEFRPARRTEEILETLYVLAQDGRTDDGGMPGALQLSVINDAYPDYAYLTTLPVAVQKALVALLAPIGRLAGYQARYTRDEIDDLR